MYFLFYVPLVYLFRTRYRTGISKFLVRMVVPLTLLFCLQHGVSLYSMGLFLFVLVIEENIYEIGYIQNDTEAIKNDPHPTMRLSAAEMAFYKSHRLIIYIWRLVLTMMFLICLECLCPKAHTLFFLAGMFFMLFVFILYNYFRNQVNMFIYFILESIRYICPFLLFPNDISCALLLLLLMIYPIEGTLELLIWKPQYGNYRGINMKKTSLHTIRIISYGILFLLSGLLYRLKWFPITYVVIMLYLFCYIFLTNFHKINR